MKNEMYLLRVTMLVGIVLACGGAVAGDWPGFRGPGGSGTSDETGLPTEWSETQNLKWKLELPGQGSSSPIVHGDRLFVTCYSGYGADNPGGDVDNLKRHLLCIDPDTGEIRWSKEIPSTAPEDAWKGFLREHGYASHTPVCDGENVFAFFGKTGIVAFDLEGREVWRTGVGTSSANRRWGSAASPILCGDLLIVNASEESRTIYALNKKTGDVVWTYKSPSTELTYGTPALVELEEGKKELVIAVPDEVWGIDPETGERLWRVETKMPGNISPSLLAAGDRVYAFGGYPRTGTVAIRAGGRGDVTSTHTVWSSKDSSYVPSAVEHDGYLYWVSHRGEAYCLKAETGERVYKEKLDTGTGNSFYASVVLADGKLYVPSRTAGTFVLAAEPAFKLIARNYLKSDPGDFNASVAISEGRIFLRSNKFLYCISDG